MNHFKRKKHRSIINLWAQAKSVANSLRTLQSPSQTRLVCTSANKITHSQQMNLQEERKWTRQAGRMRIFYTRTGLEVNDVCWLFAFVWVADLWLLSLSNYPSCQTKSRFQTIPRRPLFKEGSDESRDSVPVATRTKQIKHRVGPQMLTAQLRKRMQPCLSCRGCG